MQGAPLHCQAYTPSCSGEVRSSLHYLGLADDAWEGKHMLPDAWKSDGEAWNSQLDPGVNMTLLTVSMFSLNRPLGR